jgi:hypothetical protein
LRRTKKEYWWYMLFGKEYIEPGMKPEWFTSAAHKRYVHYDVGLSKIAC